MLSSLETLDQIEIPNERQVAALFLNGDAEERLVRMSQRVRDCYGPLIFNRGIDLRYVTADDCSQREEVLLSTGPLPRTEDGWAWTIHFENSETRETLACSVQWGGFNADKRDQPNQGRLWRSTFEINDRAALPVERATGVTAQWQHLKQDQQGGLHRKAVVFDADGILSDFVERSLQQSDILEQALAVRSARHEADIEHAARPRHNLAKMSSSKAHSLGFVGVGLVVSDHAKPDFFIDARVRSERVIRLDQFSPFMQRMLQQPELEFKAAARLK